MMTPALLVGLAGYALVSSITPGPNNLMLMTSGTNFGFRRTLPHMLGVTSGFTLMVFLVGLGLAATLQKVPYAFGLLQIASVAYLLYLAWRIATSVAPVGGADPAAAARPMTAFQAVLFQWVNPKAWSMALTSVAVYCGQDRSAATMALVAAVFGVINLPTVSLWAFVGSRLVTWLGDPARLQLFNRCAAALLVASIYPVLRHAA
jgi:threonine/homoserine/homoserine lactone efflux protein